MRTFGTLLKNELKLNIRNMNMVVFAIIMPLVVLAVLGLLYGEKNTANGVGYSFLEQSFGALCTISICAGGLMGLPLLLVMATFVLTGLSIEKATRVTQDNLRYALGAEFEMTPDYTENNPYYKMETDAEGNFEINTKMPVSQEIINTVMETDGIKSYDGMALCLVSTNLDVIPGTVPVKDKYRDLVYSRFITGTENSSFFRDGTLKLIEGSHVPVDGGNVAVISKDLAEKNGLSIGDSITLTVDGGDKTEIKIIGLFEVVKQVQEFTNINSFDKLENQIFFRHPDLSGTDVRFRGGLSKRYI